MSQLQQAITQLQNEADPNKAKLYQRFFKTGPGEYGEGDQFLGLTVPQVRACAKRFFRELQLGDIKQLLAKEKHELRLFGLIVLTYQFPKSTPTQKRAIYELYLGQTNRINNWDLVDLSAPNIVGEYMLATKLDMKLLRKLAKSTLLWERRIAVIATLAFIRAVKKQQVSKRWLQPSVELGETLLVDSHDLIHKASGWVLREVGKVDEVLLRQFLDQHLTIMPRTMLRYAIERLPEVDRKQYVKIPRSN